MEPDPTWDRIRLVLIDNQPDRGRARVAIRAALHAALVGWSGLPADCVALHAEPGEAPYALLTRPAGLQRVGLAISHDGALSVAAFNALGAVGIDVMRIADMPDWRLVAHDYLGPAVAETLAAQPAPARAAAFAHAWSAHEARLKALGSGLVEWDDALGRRLAACPVRPLSLPNGYAGHVALPPAASACASAKIAGWTT